MVMSFLVSLNSFSRVWDSLRGRAGGEYRPWWFENHFLLFFSDCWLRDCQGFLIYLSFVDDVSYYHNIRVQPGGLAREYIEESSAERGCHYEWVGCLSSPKSCWRCRWGFLFTCPGIETPLRTLSFICVQASLDAFVSERAYFDDGKSHRWQTVLFCRNRCWD